MVSRCEIDSAKGFLYLRMKYEIKIMNGIMKLEKVILNLEDRIEELERKVSMLQTRDLIYGTPGEMDKYQQDELLNVFRSNLQMNETKED